MEERKYTLKELYEFVTEYSREAREEGFDSLVGDFVDWVAARDEKASMVVQCGACGKMPIADKDGWVNHHCSYAPLPEKLGIHSSRDMNNPDDLLDILLDMQEAINTIIDYLKEKNL
jgi:hypothetical protein